MPVKSDKWIAEMSISKEMIKPFSEDQIRNGISFGTSSYGYDISLSDEFKIFKKETAGELDPKKDNSSLSS